MKLDAPKRMRIDVHAILNNNLADEFSAASLIGKSIALLGIPDSGKSNTAAVLMEELLSGGIPICVVDPAGEYHTLRDEFPDVTVVGQSAETDVQIPLNATNAYDVAQAAYLNGQSVVLDVSGMVDETREDMLKTYFNSVRKAAIRKRIPMVIFLEEAHNWIPQRGKAETTEVFTKIASEDRKRGLSLVIISQRSARVEKDVLTAADISFLHKVRHPTDMRVYTEMIPRKASWVHARVGKLKPGEALVCAGDSVLRVQMRLRRTKHIGSTPTIDDIPMVQKSLLELFGGK